MHWSTAQRVGTIERQKGAWKVHGKVGAQVPSGLWAKCEGSLRPTFFLINIRAFFVRRNGRGINFFRLNERRSQRHQRLQSAELLKAATLLRLHELLDPRMAVTDLLLA